MADFPQINGREYSFASIKLKGPKGKEYHSLRSINYKTTKTKGKIFGNGQNMIGRTRGNREHSADIEILRREFDQLKTDLLDFNFEAAGFGDVEFDIDVTYRDDGMPVVLDEIKACLIEEPDIANSQGTDGLYVKLTLSPGDILYNGDRL